MLHCVKNKLKQIASVPWIIILFVAAIKKPIQMHVPHNVLEYMNLKPGNALGKTYYRYLFILNIDSLSFIHSMDKHMISNICTAY